MKQEDIRQLIVRFMDGHTTVEEEERLAQYFRTGDVPEEWSKYKEMFAFFDEGMPRGRYDETPPESNVPEASQQEVKLVKKNSRKPFIALWSTVSATAAVALLLVIVWHRPSPDTTPDNNREAVATTSSVGSSLADSTVMKNDTVAAPQYKKKHRRTSGKYRYAPAPPKMFMSEADMKAKADSVSYSQQIDRQMAEIEQRQNAYIANIELMQRLLVISTEAEIENKATMAAVYEDEEEETVY